MVEPEGEGRKGGEGARAEVAGRREGVCLFVVNPFRSFILIHRIDNWPT
jgi:hypothetical protein